MENQAQLNYLESIRRLFPYYKKLGEQAMAQLNDEELAAKPEPESNSMSIIVKHLHGNMLSRWTDFLTSDGEKAWRDRDGEFERALEGRAQVMSAWEEGWNCVFNAINPLKEEDLLRIVYIRNEGHTVLEAINQIGSMANGSILAVFALGLLTTRTHGSGAIAGLILGIAINGLLWLFVPSVSWLWWNVIGFLVTFGTGILLGTFYRPSSQQLYVDGLQRETLERSVTEYLNTEASIDWRKRSGVLLIWFVLLLSVLFLMS